MITKEFQLLALLHNTLSMMGVENPTYNQSTDKYSFRINTIDFTLTIRERDVLLKGVHTSGKGFAVVTPTLANFSDSVSIILEQFNKLFFLYTVSEYSKN